MKAHVITIQDMDESVEVAERCIQSAEKFGTKVEFFKATMPKDDPGAIFKKERLSPRYFSTKFSRRENVLSCFLSHYFSWWKCLKDNEATLILEHDAVFTAPIPRILQGIDTYDIINFGKPSYGKYDIPKSGLGPLVSKRYLPGAHAYMITPKAAEILITEARLKAEAADIFISRGRFHIGEYFPWPVEVDDTFSTVQHEIGCRAKHNMGPDFKII
jgi:GR25 family glycosyltransferase involved in LPS biosynthesis|tara:strand:- start:1800 stop:2447 length:648 start_codon:yes stop_codon:yes gene_type:complete